MSDDPNVGGEGGEAAGGNDIVVNIGGNVMSLEEAFGKAEKVIQGFDRSTVTTTVAQEKMARELEVTDVAAKEYARSMQRAAESVAFLGGSLGGFTSRLYTGRIAMNDMAKATGSLMSSLKVLGASFAAMEAGSFLVVSTRQALQAQTALDQLNQAVRDHGGSVSAVTKQINDATAAWERYGQTRSQVAALTAMGMGRGLQPQAVTQQPRAIMDLAVALGTPGDPAAALDRVLRLGRNFDEVLSRLNLPLWQRNLVAAQIKAQPDPNRRLDLLLGVVERSQFAGQGTARADAAAGRLDKFNAALTNFQQEAGTALLPVITGLADAGTKLLDVFQGMETTLGNWGATITALGAAIGGLVVGYGTFAYARAQIRDRAESYARRHVPPAEGRVGGPEDFPEGGPARRRIVRPRRPSGGADLGEVIDLGPEGERPQRAARFIPLSQIEKAQAELQNFTQIRLSELQRLLRTSTGEAAGVMHVLEERGVVGKPGAAIAPGEPALPRGARPVLMGRDERVAAYHAAQQARFGGTQYETMREWAERLSDADKKATAAILKLATDAGDTGVSLEDLQKTLQMTQEQMGRLVGGLRARQILMGVPEMEGAPTMQRRMRLFQEPPPKGQAPLPAWKPSAGEPFPEPFVGARHPELLSYARYRDLMAKMQGPLGAENVPLPAGVGVAPPEEWVRAVLDESRAPASRARIKLTHENIPIDLIERARGIVQQSGQQYITSKGPHSLREMFGREASGAYSLSHNQAKVLMEALQKQGVLGPTEAGEGRPVMGWSPVPKAAEGARLRTEAEARSRFAESISFQRGSRFMAQTEERQVAQLRGWLREFDKDIITSTALMKELGTTAEETETVIGRLTKGGVLSPIGGGVHRIRDRAATSATRGETIITPSSEAPAAQPVVPVKIVDIDPGVVSEGNALPVTDVKAGVGGVAGPRDVSAEIRQAQTRLGRYQAIAENLPSGQEPDEGLLAAIESLENHLAELEVRQEEYQRAPQSPVIAVGAARPEVDVKTGQTTGRTQEDIAREAQSAANDRELRVRQAFERLSQTPPVQPEMPVNPPPPKPEPTPRAVPAEFEAQLELTKEIIEGSNRELFTITYLQQQLGLQYEQGKRVLEGLTQLGYLERGSGGTGWQRRREVPPGTPGVGPRPGVPTPATAPLPTEFLQKYAGEMSILGQAVGAEEETYRGQGKGKYYRGFTKEELTQSTEMSPEEFKLFWTQALQQGHIKQLGKPGKGKPQRFTIPEEYRELAIGPNGEIVATGEAAKKAAKPQPTTPPTPPLGASAAPTGASPFAAADEIRRQFEEGEISSAEAMQRLARLTQRQSGPQFRQGGPRAGLEPLPSLPVGQPRPLDEEAARELTLSLTGVKTAAEDLRAAILEYIDRVGVTSEGSVAARFGAMPGDVWSALYQLSEEGKVVGGLHGTYMSREMAEGSGQLPEPSLPLKAPPSFTRLPKLPEELQQQQYVLGLARQLEAQGKEVSRMSLHAAATREGKMDIMDVSRNVRALVGGGLLQEGALGRYVVTRSEAGLPVEKRRPRPILTPDVYTPGFEPMHLGEAKRIEEEATLPLRDLLREYDERRKRIWMKQEPEPEPATGTRPYQVSGPEATARRRESSLPVNLERVVPEFDAAEATRKKDAYIENLKYLQEIAKQPIVTRPEFEGGAEASRRPVPPQPELPPVLGEEPSLPVNLEARPEHGPLGAQMRDVSEALARLPVTHRRLLAQEGTAGQLTVYSGTLPEHEPALVAEGGGEGTQGVFTPMKGARVFLGATQAPGFAAAHELGHALSFAGQWHHPEQAPLHSTKEFQDLFEQERGNIFLPQYATERASEMFAEGYALHTQAPHVLRSMSPHLADYFEGLQVPEPGIPTPALRGERPPVSWQVPKDIWGKPQFRRGQSQRWYHGSRYGLGEKGFLPVPGISWFASDRDAAASYATTALSPRQEVWSAGLKLGNTGTWDDLQKAIKRARLTKRERSEMHPYTDADLLGHPRVREAFQKLGFQSLVFEHPNIPGGELAVTTHGEQIERPRRLKHTPRTPWGTDLAEEKGFEYVQSLLAQDAPQFRQPRGMGQLHGFLSELQQRPRTPTDFTGDLAGSILNWEKYNQFQGLKEIEEATLPFQHGTPRVLGTGGHAMALDIGGGHVLRLQPGASEATLPHDIQGVSGVNEQLIRGLAGDIGVTVSRKAEDVGKATEAELRELQTHLRHQGYDFWDVKPENVGRVGGQLSVIDPGAVRPLRELPQFRQGAQGGGPASHDDALKQIEALQAIRDYLARTVPEGMSVSARRVGRELGMPKEEAIAQLMQLQHLGVTEPGGVPGYFKVLPGHGTAGPGGPTAAPYNLMEQSLSELQRVVPDLTHKAWEQFTAEGEVAVDKVDAYAQQHPAKVPIVGRNELTKGQVAAAASAAEGPVVEVPIVGVDDISKAQVQAAATAAEGPAIVIPEVARNEVNAAQVAGAVAEAQAIANKEAIEVPVHTGNVAVGRVERQINALRTWAASHTVSIKESLAVGAAITISDTIFQNVAFRNPFTGPGTPKVTVTWTSGDAQQLEKLQTALSNYYKQQQYTHGALKVYMVNPGTIGPNISLNMSHPGAVLNVRLTESQIANLVRLRELAEEQNSFLHATQGQVYDAAHARRSAASMVQGVTQQQWLRDYQTWYQTTYHQALTIPTPPSQRTGTGDYGDLDALALQNQAWRGKSMQPSGGLQMPVSLHDISWQAMGQELAVNVVGMLLFTAIQGVIMGFFSTSLTALFVRLGKGIKNLFGGGKDGPGGLGSIEKEVGQLPKVFQDAFKDVKLTPLSVVLPDISKFHFVWPPGMKTPTITLPAMNLSLPHIDWGKVFGTGVNVAEWLAYGWVGWIAGGIGAAFKKIDWGKVGDAAKFAGEVAGAVAAFIGAALAALFASGKGGGQGVPSMPLASIGTSGAYQSLAQGTIELIGSALGGGISKYATKLYDLGGDVIQHLMDGIKHFAMASWPSFLPWPFGGDRPKHGEVYLSGKNYPEYVKAGGKPPNAPSGYEYVATGNPALPWRLEQKTHQGATPIPSSFIGRFGGGSPGVSEATILGTAQAAMSNVFGTTSKASPGMHVNTMHVDQLIYQAIRHVGAGGHPPVLAGRGAQGVTITNLNMTVELPGVHNGQDFVSQVEQEISRFVQGIHVARRHRG